MKKDNIRDLMNDTNVCNKGKEKIFCRVLYLINV